MKTYVVRDQNKIVILKITEKVYKQLVMSSTGHFSTNMLRNKVYVIDKDFYMRPHPDVTVFLWKNTYVQEEFD